MNKTKMPYFNHKVRAVSRSVAIFYKVRSNGDDLRSKMNVFDSKALIIR